MEYKKILDKLINASFPRLKNFKIFIIEKKILNLRYSAVTGYFVFCGLIIIHPKVSKYPGPALRGLLVHELSHLDIIIRKNFWSKIKFAVNFIFTKKGKINNETNADKLTIKKGYGKDLLKLVTLVEKQKSHIKNRAKKGYLTSKQIKKLL